MSFSGKEDSFDLFFSYARADDEAHNGWVTAFEWYIRNKIQAELERDERAREFADKFKICYDKTAFPQAGDLEVAIDDYVRKSSFLFIFLGMGYLNSKFCLSEMEIFRHAVGGTIKDALSRTYMIVLDQEAVERLEGSMPLSLPRDRSRFGLACRRFPPG
jgi:hypothetical protein